MIGVVIHSLQLHRWKIATAQLELLYELLAVIGQGEGFNTGHARLRPYLDHELLTLPAGTLVRNSPRRGDNTDRDGAGL